MDREIDDWLEQQYQEFERKFVTHCRYWRAPAHTLKRTHLYDLFVKFMEVFPDHSTDTNTVFYLTESVNDTPAHHSVLVWCSHFEHTLLEDLRNLTSFMDDAGRVLSTSEESSGVEILDNYGEWVVLVFYSARDNVIELLKSRGKRGGEE